MITLLPGENLKGHLPVPFHKNMSEFILKIGLFSSLMFGSLKKLSVLVLAHLLLTPFLDVSHSFTSVQVSAYITNEIY